MMVIGHEIKPVRFGRVTYFYGNVLLKLNAEVDTHDLPGGDLKHFPFFRV